jgi:hypothetical protein
MTKWRWWRRRADDASALDDVLAEPTGDSPPRDVPADETSQDPAVAQGYLSFQKAGPRNALTAIQGLTGEVPLS